MSPYPHHVGELITLESVPHVVGGAKLHDSRQDEFEKQAADQIEAKRGILRLRAQLRRLEEEHEVLKMAARSFAREPG